MTSLTNHQYRLAARPVGLPKPSDWTYTTSETTPPGEGEVLVKTLYLSLDPAMRGWMNEGKSYIPPVKLGEVMRALGVGKIIESRAEGFPVGSHVSGMLGVQEYSTQPGRRLQQVDPRLAPLPVYLSVLGMPGMTGYFGLLEVGQPQPGETVVVSGAAGAVGLVVGQVAKLKGCKVVGIAGGADKCRYVVDELGFDSCVDYKAGSVKAQLREQCPQGIDVYFDNVGGDILDDCLTQLALHGRIIICGAISQYNNTTPVKGPANYLSLLVNRGRMQGIVVSDYMKQYGEAVRAMGGWLREGKMRSKEDIVSGIETFPDTLLKLFRGENLGKLVLKVADE